ncbi:hypothetical protein [Kineococcus indalonis]|uniref:hypothetical protein n=1 Tax=Kineococcus indalonis TaxID=2696566 RepID=UPI00141340C7|nr:hypothetical protein [Kineococcus indalonis]NAZ86478.1 hypothetical protein [Kineococcus indalonis]
MRITKRVVAAGTVGAVAAGGLGLVLLGAPIASAAEGTTGTSSSTGAGERLQRLKDALAGLVTDGTLTQEQADEVATTLDSSEALRGGPGGGRGGRVVDLTAAAEAIGVTEDELRTALQADGATLAGVAAEHDVERQALVDALVAAGEERLARAVTDGRLTREQADARSAELPDAVAAAVDRELRAGGPGGRRGGPGTDDGTDTDTDADAGAAAA